MFSKSRSYKFHTIRMVSPATGRQIPKRRLTQGLPTSMLGHREGYGKATVAKWRHWWSPSYSPSCPRYAVISLYLRVVVYLDHIYISYRLQRCIVHRFCVLAGQRIRWLSGQIAPFWLCIHSWRASDYPMFLDYQCPMIHVDTCLINWIKKGAHCNCKK